ncbi:MAG: NAD(+) synthase [Cytophagales bacterium]|nr:MAG: NAD(+) synthase [Cytophagales bacterium]TAF61265.1 MAG: NAD(+) synthase [Cytophagales bacterium]
MKLIKVAGAVLNQVPMDWRGNQARILEAIKQAREQQVSVLCLPELCITGYGCEDMFYAPSVHQKALDVLWNIVPQTQNMVVCLGLPIIYQNRIFNTSALVVNGRILGFVAKRFLAGNGIHYEPRWFTPWEADKRIELPLFNPQSQKNEYFGFGDVFFDVGGIKIGFEICEDAWVANRPGRGLYAQGVDVILNPSASHFAFGKLDVRKRFVLEGSRAFGVAYVYANLLGNEAGRAIYDGGVIIASSGSLVAVGERLSFHDVLLTTAVIDVAAARMAQAQASMVFQVTNLENTGIPAEFSFPAVKPEAQRSVSPAWESCLKLQEEEFTRALTLGLFDYMRKSRSNGFVVSLSGGADSAAVLACCALMIKMGCRSIGFEAFKQKISYLKGIEKAKSEEQIAKLLLTSIYQGSKNSSQTTRNAAREVAKALNSQHHEVNISNMVNQYTNAISKAIDRPLTWEQDDIVLQNIQARVRAPSAWMLANLQNGLLLSTSNRSEAAVGYATMDGDTSGGLSPIAGIDKAFLRQWLRWLEKEGPLGENLAIPALRYINQQQPTAELRPSEQKQTDEDDLMPYDVLDEIEEAAIRDKKSPIECLLLLEARHSEVSRAMLKEWVRKFFRLWSRNQWKRERYAPSFHLDDKNLDPKTWCRFPILSSGFEQEIEEMMQS